MDSKISLLPKSEISSFWPSAVAAHAGLCQTGSETPKTRFLASRLISITDNKTYLTDQKSMERYKKCVQVKLQNANVLSHQKYIYFFCETNFQGVNAIQTIKPKMFTDQLPFFKSVVL